MSTATVATGSGPRSLAVDPSGKLAYVTNAAGGDVSQYTIGANGSLTPAAAAVAAGTSPVSFAVDPLGKFAYAANSGSNSVLQYTIAAGGSLTPMSTATVPAPQSVTVDPSGR